MKQHKIAFIISIVTTVISLVCFLCSALICFSGNGILQDISAALFSSSVFVIALSSIGYFVEKNKLKEKILSDDFTSAITSLLSIVDDKNNTNRQGVNKIVVEMMKKIVSIRFLLSEYYDGLFFKDKLLQNLINEKLRNFAKTLCDLEVYIAYPSRKGEVVSIHFANVISEYEILLNDFDNWMEKRKFKLGDNFNFGDNFISEYEQKAEELKNKKNS